MLERDWQLADEREVGVAGERFFSLSKTSDISLEALNQNLVSVAGGF